MAKNIAAGTPMKTSKLEDTAAGTPAAGPTPKSAPIRSPQLKRVKVECRTTLCFDEEMREAGLGFGLFIISFLVYSSIEYLIKIINLLSPALQSIPNP